jgi:hypothetical protein
MVEGVGFAVIENQKDRLHTSSKFYFQMILSAIALLNHPGVLDIVKVHLYNSKTLFLTLMNNL